MLALSFFITHLVLHRMREEDRRLFSSLRCLGSQKELIHRNLCILNVVVLKVLLLVLNILIVSQTIEPMQAHWILLGHLADVYLIVEATILRLIVHSKTQVFIASELNRAHGLLSRISIISLLIIHS